MAAMLSRYLPSLKTAEPATRALAPADGPRIWIVPEGAALSEREVDALLAKARAGALVVADAHALLFDERLRGRDDAALRRLFGVRRATGRKLAMVWGVHCVLTSDPENQAAMVRKACRIAFDEGFARAGEGVIIVAGVPLGSPGTTNMVRIAYLDGQGNPVAEGV